MGKRTYLAPITKTVHINSENLMLIASPGIDGNYVQLSRLKPRVLTSSRRTRLAAHGRQTIYGMSK